MEYLKTTYSFNILLDLYTLAVVIVNLVTKIRTHKNRILINHIQQNNQ